MHRQAMIWAAGALLGGPVMAQPATAPSAGWEGVWCWGTYRQSSETPFLKIDRDGDRWVLRTKHYMHGDFGSPIKSFRIEGKWLGFLYWYEPLKRWARCSLTLDGFMMAGRCEAETSAQTWGYTDSYLWKEGVLSRPADAAPASGR